MPCQIQDMAPEIMPSTLVSADKSQISGSALAYMLTSKRWSQSTGARQTGLVPATVAIPGVQLFVKPAELAILMTSGAYLGRPP